MAVQALKGRPGGGKSYRATAFHVYPALLAGRYVVTNLPLQVDYIRSLCQDFVFKDKGGVDISVNIADLIILVKPNERNNNIPFSVVEDFTDYHAFVNPVGLGPLYVIDECHRAFPAQSQTSRSESNVRRLQKISEWFAEHRHLGADVLLITQDFSKCFAPIASLSQVMYSVSKLANWSKALSNKYSFVVYDGVDGGIIGAKRILSYDEKYFKFYTSHTKAESLGLSVSESMDFESPRFYHSFSFWTFIFVTIFGIGAIFFFYRVTSTLKASVVDDSAHQRDLENAKKARLEREAKQEEVYKKNFAALVERERLGLERLRLEEEKQKREEERLAKEREQKLNNHPYAGYKLLYIGRVKYTTPTGRAVDKVLIHVYDRGHLFARLDTDYLKAMGYEVKASSPCHVQLAYLGETLPTHVICGVPNTSQLNAVAVNSAGGNATYFSGANSNQHVEANRDTGVVVK